MDGLPALGVVAHGRGEALERTRITQEQDILPERPTIMKLESFISLASRPEYAEARDLAVQDACQILTRLSGCTPEEAYLFVTTVGDLRNGGVWNIGKTEPDWARNLPLTVGVEVPYPPHKKL